MQGQLLVYRSSTGAEVTIALSKLDDEHTRVHITHVSVVSSQVGRRR
jgi:hypothetical protein